MGRHSAPDGEPPAPPERNEFLEGAIISITVLTVLLLAVLILAYTLWT